MKIVYMGTGEIGLPVLKWLLEESRHDVVGVFTQPDKPVGRKRVLTEPEVKKVAKAQGVSVFQPEKVRAPEAVADLKSLAPDLVVVMAYGQILSQAVIDAPARGCINLHASLLPRHRGASPIQAAIREGDKETGITVMFVVKALDAGDMIHKEVIPILPDDTGGSLHDRLAEIGPAALAAVLPLFESGEPVPAKPQDESLVTYAPKLEREDGEIDWGKPAAEIARLIRAYDPWPGTYTWLSSANHGLKKLKLRLPEVASDDEPGREGESDWKPGQVAEVDAKAGRLAIAAGDGGLIRPGRLQLEGGNELSVAEFLNGYHLPSGSLLGRK